MDISLKRILTSKPVLALEIAILALFGFQVGKEILKKRAIEKEITALASEINSLATEKSELADLLEYIKTDSFIQREAREKLNLVGPGEEVVVIPEADSSLAPVAGLATEAPGSGSYLANAEKWWQYFFK